MIAQINLGSGVAHYQYDAGKQRTRKTITKNNGNILEERIYLGGLELYRRKENGIVKEQIETLHLFDGEQRLLMVDQVTKTNHAKLKVGNLYRYTLSNHLGSSTVELDDKAEIVSYEEYHPYGTSAYQGGRNSAEVKLKRYRYTGMERDEESGLSYHTARYYLPWLGRWGSCDPAGILDNLNRYLYVHGRVIVAVDNDGHATKVRVPTSGPEEVLESLGEFSEVAKTSQVLNISEKTLSRGMGILEIFGSAAELVGELAAPFVITYELTNWGFKKQEEGRIFTERLIRAQDMLKSGLMTSKDAELYTSKGIYRFNGSSASEWRRQAADQYTRTGAYRELNFWRGGEFELYGTNNARLRTEEYLHDLEDQGKVSFQFNAYVIAGREEAGVVIPDVVGFEKGKLAWVGDFKAGTVPFDEQTRGFVELAATSEQRRLIFFVPASEETPQEILDALIPIQLRNYAENFTQNNRRSPVTIDVIPVPGFVNEDPWWQVNP